jgi:hypothetical protein
MYFAWSRPDEENAQLGTLENRFTALFEARRIQWPRQEHLADPAKFDQGIAGFLDHILLANFAMFADFASFLTGNSVRIAQRQTRAAHTALSSQWLVGVDTLIIISWDSNRSKQQATPEELQAARALLDTPGSTVFICPHHDVGDVREGFVNLALPGGSWCTRVADHAAAVALRQCASASDRKVRRVDREIR